MAAQGAHDVVIQTRSVGDHSLPDDHTSTTNQLPTTSVEVEEKQPSSSDHAAPVQATTASDGSTTLVNGTALDGSSLTRFDKGHADAAKSQSQSTGDEEVTRGATPTVNGDRLEPSDVEDPNVQLASADVSGGSDTESGRRGSSPAPGSDGALRGHLRSNSVKKPASFKAVSVTKSFLAKAATGSAQPSKLGGDKVSGAAPSGQSSASNPSAPPRPRLVAKSGGGRDGGLRGSISSSGNGRGSAPDPSQVWNKNRPVQPPPPKQFTDEELKQQYGIHLATRLQADETSKEAKWADIDDDDDDWAPETIEWNDGTKITLGTPDEPAGLAQAKAPVNPPKDERPSTEKPSTPPPAKPAASIARPSSTKPTSTTNGQPKPVGLVLKGAPEKPTLVAKPPAPVPVKSPWAPLPPVEKVPPVTIKPQQTQPTERVQRDPHGFDTMPAAPSPAKEIAADDFNRTWRDNQSGTSRELYNSQSGRYEPVSENRRNSMRGDQGYRQPSVLQRPSQIESRGPAEPSAAFQTSRSSGQDMGWGRRRGSSNVSGGSGAQARHPSMGKGPEMPFFPGDIPPRGRQGSQQTIFSDKATAPTSPHDQSVPEQASQLDRGRSPLASEVRHAVPGRPTWHAAMAPDGAAVQVPSASELHHQPPYPSQTVQQPGPLPGPLPVEDPIAMQKKIMRESRELALKRRKEQEEKEEAEKRERIRKKMEDLGLPPPEKTSEKATQPAPPAGTPPATEVKTMPPATEKETPRPAQSPPRPPVPESSEDIKQYGVMKVHHPVSLRKKAPSWRNVIKHHLSGPDGQGLPPPAADSAEPEQEKPLVNGIGENKAAPAQDGSHQPHPPRHREDISPHGRQDQKINKPATQVDPPRNKAHDVTSEKRPRQSSPLWGPPNSDGAPDMGSSRSEHASLFAASEPQSLRAPMLAPGPIGPPSTAQQAPDRVKSRTAVNIDAGHFAGASPSARIGTGIVPAGDIGTPTSQTMSSDAASQQRARAAWKNLPAQLEANDAAAARRAIQERDARAAEQATLGGNHHVPAMPVFKDTWRQIMVEEVGSTGQRRTIGTTEVVIGGETLNAGQLNANVSQRLPGAGPLSVQGGITSSAHSGRESRFFPHTTASSVSPEQRALQDVVADGLEAGPPPDSSDHPAYEGNTKRPNVSLPAPKPIVKLPPAAVQPPTPTTASPPKSVDMSASPPRHLEQPAPWQEKIDHLLGRRGGANGKSHMAAVTSSSKAPLEVASVRASATVSLPGRGGPTAGAVASTVSDEPEDNQSRATDEVLFEEREFGSLPTVKLPARSRLSTWQPAKAPVNQPKQRARFQRVVQATSRDPYVFKETQSPQGSVIEIRLPGSPNTTTCLFKGRSSASSSSRQRNPSTNSGHGRGGRRGGHKPREPSGGFGASRPTPPVAPAASAGSPSQGSASRPSQPSSSTPGPSMSGSKPGPPAPATWANRVAGAV